MFELAIEDRLATLAMNRPEKRNAIGNGGWAKLTDAAAEIASADVRALLLRSSVDGVFSAGADVGEFVAPGKGEAPDIAGPMRAGLDALARLPIPTIAHVDGGCFGAGVALALACDIRISGPNALFGIPPAKLGVAYPAEDLARLAAAVGRGQAARLIFSGMTIDAGEALRIGLIQFEGSGGEAHGFCNAVASNSGESLVALKALLDRGIAGSFDEESARLFAASFESRDFGVGLAAFRARQAPVFE